MNGLGARGFMNLGSAARPTRRMIAIAAAALVVVIAAIAITATLNERRVSLSEQRQTGLGAPSSHIGALTLAAPPIAARTGIVGGVPGGVKNQTERSAIPDHQVVRTASIQLFSNNPGETANRVEQVTEQFGGFIVSSNVSGSERNEQSANVELRVPEPKLDDARKALRALGTRVERESTMARDVTRDYVDQQSDLRNLRQEEQQYLAILKKATQVKDITQVTEKVSDVRGQIEKLEAESRYLAEQVQMADIALQVLPEVKATSGIGWHPWNGARLAMRSALDGLADYVDGMVSVVLHVPVVLLWAVTLALLIKIAWLLIRVMGRALFPHASWWSPKPGSGDKQSAANCGRQ